MKKVLVVLESFAPQNNCAAIPNTKLIKYLEHENVEITLITNEITGDMNIDENLVPDEMKNIRVIYIPYSRLYKATFGKTRAKITNNGVKLKMKMEKRRLRSKIVSIIYSIYYNYRMFDWMHSAKKKIRKRLKGEQFDVLYSSYPEMQSHRLARYIMKKGLAKKWIADFRDPICYEAFSGSGYEKNKEIQHQFEREADCVTIVSEGAMEKFIFDDIPESKVTYIPNGFDHDDFDLAGIQEKNTSGKLRIFYAGTLYAGKRDFTPLFKAISELADEKLIDVNNVSVEYAGAEWPVMLSFADKFNLENICSNYGYITRQRVMEIMSEIDCSAVCTHNTKTDKGVVTGKVFELLLVGKPIIAIVGGDEPDSELGNIVKQCDAGVVYEQANDHIDYENLKQWLKKKYDEKMSEGNISSELNISEREKYSYANIAHELYKIIERVAN